MLRLRRGILRLLIHDILDHHSDRLTDDATILLIEWQPRPASSG
ncbi:hypothetical protein ABT026_30270 [Streptomyces sp. NPDC002734]